MSKFVRLTSTFLFLVWTGVWFVQGQQRNELNGRTFSFTHSTNALARQSIFAEMREFVWHSWIEKRKVKIRASHPVIDGFPTVTEISVRKDSKGLWYVEAVTTRRLGFFGLRKHEIERVRSYDVDRVEVISFEGAAEIPTPLKSNVVRDAKLYRVRLKMENRLDDFIF